RTRPGAVVARHGLDTGCLIDRRGGPRYGPPHPPSLGRAPAQPWHASGWTQDVSSIVLGGPDMAPQIVQAKGATPPSDSPGHRSDAPRRSRGAPRAGHRMSHRCSLLPVNDAALGAALLHAREGLERQLQPREHVALALARARRL